LMLKIPRFVTRLLAWARERAYRVPYAPRPLEGAPAKLSELPHAPTFVVGTGRSGTHFLHELMRHDPGIASFHADTRRTSAADSFVQYCLWNELPVDTGAFLGDRLQVVSEVSREGRIYFEANSYLSFCVRLLFDALQASFILLVRRPEDVVNSHGRKGRYANVPLLADRDKALGYQPCLTPNHTFGRLVPRGPEFERWGRLTQTGRIGWYWNAVNTRVLEQFAHLPEGRTRVVAVEDIDYSRYRDLHALIGGSAPLAEKKFERIRNARPGKGPVARSADRWSELERQEFLAETRIAREKLSALIPDWPKD